MEYRKRISGNTEEYCAINVSPFKGPASKGFVIRTLLEPEFLATHTYKIFGSATLFPRMTKESTISALACEDGWKMISGEEYGRVLSEVVGSVAM